jgi:pimeloyl-[acyl-carrier protein] methyl ester esterase
LKIPLVLLPGLDGTGLLFADFVANLASDIDPIVVRYPPDLPLGYAELEAIARESLPEHSPFVLLGESFSGPIAISIAASAPRGLRGLILCCSFASGPRPLLGKLWPLVRWFPFYALSHSFLSSYLMGPFSSPGLISALDRARACVAPVVFKERVTAVCEVDVAPELHEVKVPILDVRASKDRVVPRVASEAIERIAPSVRTVQLEGPHYLLQACPLPAAALISEFTRELCSDL